MNRPDTIEIRRLRLATHIGVSDEERSTPQTLWITVHMVPNQGFNGLNDLLSHTVDYQSVALEIQALATAKPRCLIESLAIETANWLLEKHPLQSVSITLEKHILPDTDCVAVHLTRKRVDGLT